MTSSGGDGASPSGRSSSVSFASACAEGATGRVSSPSRYSMPYFAASPRTERDWSFMDCLTVDVLARRTASKITSDADAMRASLADCVTAIQHDVSGFFAFEETDKAQSLGTKHGPLGCGGRRRRAPHERQQRLVVNKDPIVSPMSAWTLPRRRAVRALSPVSALCPFLHGRNYQRPMLPCTQRWFVSRNRSARATDRAGAAP